jgi:hypothetical protein
VGYRALRNTTGYYNTAAGAHALYSNTTGGNNSAFGAKALYTNTTGDGNSAFGVDALYSNMTDPIYYGYYLRGEYNTAVGYRALYANTTGKYNTATGYCALGKNETGRYNTAYGTSSFGSCIEGQNNTAIGYLAGRNITSASCYTAIGALTVAYNGVINATAIGYDTQATANDQVRIGNSSVTSIGGYANWSNISDGRGKKNIRANVPGLAFINSLQPVTYNLDLDAIDGLFKFEKPKRDDDDMPEPTKSQELIDIEKKSREKKEKQVQTGFVAQDVEKSAKSLGYDFSGVEVDEIGIYSLRYGEFVVPLVKAVQELSEQNDRLNEQNEKLNRQIEDLVIRLEKLERR